MEKYSLAGVNIALEQDAIKSLVSNFSYRRMYNGIMLGKIGNYAGLVDIGDKVLGITTDGVGTKMMVADRFHLWREIGIDCIAMNVNDLYAMNIEPIAFVDYIATDKIDLKKFKDIGVGLNIGAKLADITIVGGETATLGKMVRGTDLSGTAVGIQELDKIITGEKIVPGDCIVGIPSSGIHANGLTLARKIIDENNAWDKKIDGYRILEIILRPTRIYSDVFSLAKEIPIHGMCHITGGGLFNFMRLSGYGYVFSDPLPVPKIFSWLQKKGDVSDKEMYRTFNMGMGFACIIGKEWVKDALDIIPDAKLVGYVIETPEIIVNNKKIG